MKKEAAENSKAKSTQSKTLHINVPKDLNVLYSDSAWITASKYGLVFDFAQTVGPTDTQNVVSRIGMSKAHAERFMQVLQQKIVEMQAIED